MPGAGGNAAPAARAAQRVCPAAGRVVLFPGWLRHGVQPFAGLTQPRVSISFNLVVRAHRPHAAARPASCSRGPPLHLWWAPELQRVLLPPAASDSFATTATAERLRGAVPGYWETLARTVAGVWASADGGGGGGGDVAAWEASEEGALHATELLAIANAAMRGPAVGWPPLTRAALGTVPAGTALQLPHMELSNATCALWVLWPPSGARLRFDDTRPEYGGAAIVQQDVHVGVPWRAPGLRLGPAGGREAQSELPVLPGQVLRWPCWQPATVTPAEEQGKPLAVVHMQPA